MGRKLEVFRQRISKWCLVENGFLYLKENGLLASVLGDLADENLIK